MRLGDFDALLAELQRRKVKAGPPADDPWGAGWYRGFENIEAAIDAAPTLRCAECDHYLRSSLTSSRYCDHDQAQNIVNDDGYGPPADFGCVHFTRREAT